MQQRHRNVNKGDAHLTPPLPIQTSSASAKVNGKSSKGRRSVIGVFCSFVLFGLLLVIGTLFYLSVSRRFPKFKRSIANSRQSAASRRRPIDETITTTSGGYEYHVVFSTGCSLYQDWQSYVFFYNAVLSNQPGTITRIVSGCANSDEESKMKAIFDEEIYPMEPSGRLKIHFTPDYSKLKNGKSFVYFNKPFGMKHWLENALGYPSRPINDDAIIILVDPDQLIMRPFTNNNFSNTEWKFLNPDEAPRSSIHHGQPMGQLYGFGLQWKNQVNMTQLGFPNSPVDRLSYREAQAGYILGPPYVATAQDMYTIVNQWTIFAHGVHDQYPFLLAEMYAYCLAAAHRELPHQTASSFMISDIAAGRGEGWSYIDQIPNEKVCDDFDIDDVPNVLHYCQRYGMGDYFFGKRKLPRNFLSCDSPLLAEPPKDILTKYNYANFPGNNRKTWTHQYAKRNAFTVCYMIKALNEAAIHYKEQHCESKKANFQKTLFLSHGQPGS
jgi:peptidyl serine alpha-galactosyltransferase